MSTGPVTTSAAQPCLDGPDRAPLAPVGTAPQTASAPEVGVLLPSTVAAPGNDHALDSLGGLGVATGPGGPGGPEASDQVDERDGPEHWEPTWLPLTDLTVDRARLRLSGAHFAKECLSQGERDLLYIAEGLLRLLDEQAPGGYLR